MDRNIDGCYFRVERENQWENHCFSDLTSEEREDAIKEWDLDSLKRLCYVLADALKEVGDSFDIVYGVFE